MSPKTLFFDLDDTLYPTSAGVWSAIRERMDQYMHERLKLEWDAIPKMRQHFLETYGTTLRGLQHQFAVDTEDFLAYVHNLPVQEMIQPNPNLRAILLSLPQTRWVFTNADDKHAARVLSALRIEDCFQGIIDVHAMEFIPKPDPLSYQKALDLAGAVAQESVIFDDAQRNLIPAQKMGFTTVLINTATESRVSNESADYSLTSLEDMPTQMAYLWARQGN
jgi:putative hydrolase of the HAD superfamily